MEFQNFTSLPPDQEASFIVFERHGAEAAKSGMTIGIIAGIAIGLLILLISFTVPPKQDQRDADAKTAGAQVQKAAESGK